MKKILLAILALIIAGAAFFWFNRDQVVKEAFSPSKISGEKGVSVTSPESVVTSPESVVTSPESEAEVQDVEVIAQDLQIPWDLAFLPTGDILATERPGTLIRLSDGLQIPISGVAHRGEGGLLGIALHPDFINNNFLYLYLTTQVGGSLQNRVERYTLEENSLIFDREIIGGIPGASYHDGGQTEFGPDGLLYISTGDAGNSNLAQDRNSLAGKILRLNDDGSIPSDNPFDTAIYSYGHRNVQGLAWDNQGRLWATEHGRSGIRSGLDELNLIEPGKNYGWPVIQGNEEEQGMVTPVINSGADVTWAPGGIAYLKGSLFFAGLRGNALYQFEINSNTLTSHFYQEFGRIRAVNVGPDGFLYITTSNRDGRGDVQAGDDKIIKINPQIFNK